MPFNKLIVATFLFFVLFLMLPLGNDAMAQCAMCSASVENSISDGGRDFGAGLNQGILYLMLAPYVLIASIGYAWYRNSKKYTAEQRSWAAALKNKLG